jgi:hypothetical protein
MRASARERGTMRDDDLRAKVFEDRAVPGQWRVEKIDGGYDGLATFTGPNAREHAMAYADRRYGDFDLISLPPY